MDITQDMALEQINRCNQNNTTTNSFIIIKHRENLFIEVLPRALYKEAQSKLVDCFDNNGNQTYIPTKDEYEKLTQISTQLNPIWDIESQIIDNDKYLNLYNELINVVKNQNLDSLIEHLSNNVYKRLYFIIDLDCKFKELLNNNNKVNNLTILKYGDKSLIDIINKINNQENSEVIHNFITQHSKQKEVYEKNTLELIRSNWREMKNPMKTEEEIKVTNAESINNIYTNSTTEFKQKILNELIRNRGSLVPHDEIKNYLKRVNINKELTEAFTNKYTEKCINEYFNDFNEQLTNFYNKDYYKSFEYFNNNFKTMINNDLGKEKLNKMIEKIDINQINQLSSLLEPEIMKQFKEVRLEITNNELEKEQILKTLNHSMKENRLINKRKDQENNQR